jgi:hypothetical protein
LIVVAINTINFIIVNNGQIFVTEKIQIESNKYNFMSIKGAAWAQAMMANNYKIGEGVKQSFRRSV